MTNNLPWFRFYPEALNDRKIQRVCLVTKQPKALVIGVWTTILALASDSPERGKLLISEDVPITLDEILMECGIDDPTIVNAFEDLGMIYVENETFHVTNWNGRQFASDDSTARVRKHRAKKKAEPEPEEPKIEPESSENGTESPKVTLPTPKTRKNDGYVKQECNVSVTPPESDTESDTDKDSVPKGTAAKPPPVGPKTIARDIFLEKTNLKMPDDKPGQRFWWSQFAIIAKSFDDDPKRIELGIVAVVDYMDAENLTVTSPKSVVDLCRAQAAGRLKSAQKNGAVKREIHSRFAGEIPEDNIVKRLSQPGAYRL